MLKYDSKLASYIMVGQLYTCRILASSFKVLVTLVVHANKINFLIANIWSFEPDTHSIDVVLLFKSLPGIDSFWNCMQVKESKDNKISQKPL